VTARALGLLIGYGADRIWGDRSPRGARATLHGYISRLRQALAAASEAVITRQPGGYVLTTADTVTVDLHSFHRLIAQARAADDDTRAAALFEQALRQVVSETEALRLQFIEHRGDPRQVVAAACAWSMPILDLSAETDPRASAEAWMRADLDRAIDPARGPLFGYALIRASRTRFFWYSRYNHTVMDGFGMWLVARRLAKVYTQLCSGGSSHEPLFGSLCTSMWP